MWSKRFFKLGLIISWLSLFSIWPLQAEGMSQANKVSIHWSGYGQLQYDSLQGKPETFRLRRARLNLKVKTPAGWQLKIQFDPARSPGLLDLKFSLALSARMILHLGQFKVPFSRESLTSSGSLETINRSRTVEYLCPGRDNKAKGRDIGLALQGEMSSFEYQVGLFNGAGINCKDDNSQKDLAARLVFRPVKNMGIGYSYYRGTAALLGEVEEGNKRRNDLEAWWQAGRFLVQGEWLWGSTSGLDAAGAYLLGGYDLVPEKLRVVARVEKIDLDKSRETDDLRVITFGLTWFFPGKSKLQINYEIHREKEIELDNNAFLIQLQVGF